MQVNEGVFLSQSLIQEEYIQTPTKMASDVGGLSGLFLGMSLWSILQTLMNNTNVVMFTMKKKNKGVA